MNFKHHGAAVIAAAGLIFGASTATAGSANRAFVSGHGTDAAGCGAPTAPCRSLQFTHDNIVGAGGEIDILDPAGYGAVVITKALSIVNDGVGTAGVQTTNGNAITVTTTSSDDTVFLRGLNIDGVLSAGKSGVLFDGQGVLVIVGCTARHFATAGVVLAPATSAAGSQFVLIDDILSDNGVGLAFVRPAGASTFVRAMVERVVASGNENGGVINASLGSHSARFSISDSTFSDNFVDGLQLAGAAAVADTARVTIDASHFDLNGRDGLFFAGGAPVAHLSRSVFTQNGQGIDDSGIVPPGALFSNGDNRVEGNLSADLVGTTPSVDGLR